MKPLKYFWQGFRRNADACIADTQFNFIARLAQPNFDLARQCKFESVRQEVEYNLLPHVGIDESHLAQTRTVDNQIDSSFLARRSKVACELSRQAGEVGGFV